MAELKRHSRSNEKVSTQVQSTSDNTEIKSTVQDPCLQDLVWRDLTSEQVISLIPLTPQELEAKLAEICSCHKYKICLNKACILDYYVSAFWFSKRVHFTTEQISAFFSLIKILLENIRDQQMPLLKNIGQLRNYLKSIVYEKHMKQTSLALFTIEQGKLITDYVAESLFQHYKLYELLFSTGTSDKDVIINQRLFVEVPPRAELPFPPPLDEGIPEDIYTEYVLEPSIQPSQHDRNTAVELKDERNQNPETSVPIQDKMADGDNATENADLLLKQLEPEEIKQALRTVSHGILKEVKSAVEKKLKERESIILSKLSKK